MGLAWLYKLVENVRAFVNKRQRFLIVFFFLGTLCTSWYKSYMKIIMGIAVENYHAREEVVTIKITQIKKNGRF